MAVEHIIPLSQISKSEQNWRKTAKFALAPLSRNHEIHITDGMQRARELHQEGYGILVVFPHFSKMDPVVAMDVMVSDPEFANVKFTAPIGHHQRTWGIPKYLGSKSGINIMEIVTSETLGRAKKKGNPKGLKKSQGVIEYANQLAETISTAGVGIVAPTGTRVPTIEYKLDEDGDEIGKGSIELIARLAQRKGAKMAIHILGLGIPDTRDYSARKGINFTQKYIALHGPTYTLEEALEKASLLSVNPTGRLAGLKNLDQFVMNEIAENSPFYLKPQSMREKNQG